MEVGPQRWRKLLIISPALRGIVETPGTNLRWTQSVRGAVTTRSVGTINEWEQSSPRWERPEATTVANVLYLTLRLRHRRNLRKLPRAFRMGRLMRKKRECIDGRETQLPATIIFSINTEPVRMLLRSSRSLPTATICLNMSRMLPAMVTS